MQCVFLNRKGEKNNVEIDPPESAGGSEFKVAVAIGYPRAGPQSPNLVTLHLHFL